MLVAVVRLFVVLAAVTGATRAQTVPEFSATPTSGVQPLSVEFTNLTTSDALSVFYEWEYGDGEVGPDPFHTYAASGTYTVTLTAYPIPLAPPVSITKTDLISVLPGTLDVDFTASVTSGSAPLTVDFDGLVTGDTAPDTFAWDFGDGSGAAVEDPTHTYDQAGVYTVSFSASLADLSDSETKVGLIDVAAPQFEVGFDASASEVAVGQSIVFTDTSISDVPYTRHWDFGDGSQPWYVHSSQPVHQYLAPGDYAVSLTISGPGIEDSTSWPGGITVTEVDLAVAIGGVPLSGHAPLVAPFQGLVLGGTLPGAWSWDFGDGSQPWYAVNKNPQHIYLEPGVYDVAMTATFGGETASDSAPAAVEVFDPELTPGLHVFPRGGLTPVVAEFTDMSSAAAPSWSTVLEFGDGESTSAPSATHAYGGTAYWSPRQVLQTMPPGIGETLQLTNGIQVVQATVVTFNSFAEPQAWTGLPSNRYLRLADVNGDGRDDLISESGAAAEFCVFLQLAHGFDEEPICTSSSKGSSNYEDIIGTADVNADGHLDVVRLPVGTDSRLEVLHGDGSGQFTVGFTLPVQASAAWGTLLDVDEDGQLDAVLGLANGGGASARLNIAYADGLGGFLPPVGPFQVFPSSRQPRVGDLDGDGHLDLVGYTGNDEVRYVLGDGQAFGPAQILTTHGSPDFFASRPVALGDVDGDGLLDIVVATPTTLEVAFGADGHAAMTLVSATTWARSAALGDLDGDGDDDYVAVRAGRADGTGGVNLWSGLPLPPNDREPRQRLLLDVDGDGLLDVLSSYESAPQLSLHRNLGIIGRWVDIGGEMRGSAGTVRLAGQGTLLADTAVGLSLTGAAPDAPAWLVMGTDDLLQPFQGGVLVPRADVVVGGLLTDAAGGLNLESRWPDVPAQTPSWWQVWVTEGADLVGSNGLLAIAAE